jgi:hypothetical protein
MNSKGSRIPARDKKRWACARIARALLEGPEWLDPPKRVDDFGWLNPVLIISVVPLGVDKPCYSYSVFVDDTTNRDDNFLKPVVRKAYWHRPGEYLSRRPMNWPMVDVHHHVMNSSEQRQMHRLLRCMDISFRKIDFLTGGLITDRTAPSDSFPKGELPSPRSLFVKRRNGCQYIEFGLDEYAGKNKHIELAAKALMRYADTLCEKPEALPYRECYPKDLHNEMSGRSRWFYRPKRTRG